MPSSKLLMTRNRTAVTALLVLVGCGAPIDRAADSGPSILDTIVPTTPENATAAPVSATAPAEPTPTSTSTSTMPASCGVSAATLREFRDAAAAAPVWDYVDWTPPTTFQEVAGAFDAIAIGVVREAATATRAVDFKSYDLTATLYHVEVTLSVDIDPSRSTTQGEDLVSAVPISTAGAEGLAGLETGLHAAERVIANAPIGATGVFVVDYDRGDVTPVAFESIDEGLVAYYGSMDAAVQGLTITQVLDAGGGYIAP